MMQRSELCVDEVCTREANDFKSVDSHEVNLEGVGGGGMVEADEACNAAPLEGLADET